VQFKDIPVVVVVLPDPLQGVEGMEELHGDPQLGHAPRLGTEVKNGKSSAKNGVLERLRC